MCLEIVQQLVQRCSLILCRAEPHEFPFDHVVGPGIPGELIAANQK